MLPLKAVFQFAKCSVASRNFCEGEAVLNAGHIIMCGQLAAPPADCFISIYSLVLQSSKIAEKPHTIEGKIHMSLRKIESFLYSCKAGQSQCCKHIVAVLLFLNRNAIQDLEKLSGTDVKCVWTAGKASALADYKPAPLEAFCCVEMRKKSSTEIDEQKLAKILAMAEEVAPGSGYELHRKGRRPPPTSDGPSGSLSSVTSFVVDSRLEVIISHACESEVLQKLEDSPTNLTKSCCLDRYSKMVAEAPNSVQLCKITQADRSLWEKERKYRITGSRCYSIYTAMQNPKTDWRLKANRYFWPKKFSNVFVKHGLHFEKEARQAYMENTDKKVIECGLITNQNHPWLAYSPDGIIMGENGPAALLEIKCPYLGATHTIADVLPTCSFLDKDFCLKRRHEYYGQVTLGMVMTNVKTCEFVMYCSHDGSYAVQSIPLDNEFANRLLSTLRRAFFENMLHALCENTSSILPISTKDCESDATNACGTKT